MLSFDESSSIRKSLKSVFAESGASLNAQIELTMNANFNANLNPQQQQILKKKRKKTTGILFNDENNKENQCSHQTMQVFKKDQQMVKKLKLSNVTNVLFERKQQTLIEFDECSSMDSGYNSNLSPATQKSEVTQLYEAQMNLEDEFMLLEEVASPKFPTFQSQMKKSLNFSICSPDVLNNSTNLGARRCLFKSTPEKANSSPAESNNATTPVSIHRSICSVEKPVITDELSLSSIFESSFDESKQNTQFKLNVEKKTLHLEMNHEKIKQSLEIECKQQIFSFEHKVESGGVSCEANGERLIGDRSRGHVLPCRPSLKHNDLSAITPQTLCQVLAGEYNTKFDKLVIIDARYPYEFDGGHIHNALNIYTKEKLLEFFIAKKNEILGGEELANKRVLVVFHCEFSSERGPGMLRFLRNQDRDLNRDHYPKLFYPELYLLEGGYKAFFEHSSKFCEPKTYLPMLHEDYAHDLKHFRAKTKTWQAQSRHCATATKATSLVSRLQRFPRSNLF